MTFNPYIQQMCEQTAMTESEARKSSRPAKYTDAEAQKHGFDTATEFEEALWDFLNGN